MPVLCSRFDKSRLLVCFLPDYSTTVILHLSLIYPSIYLSICLFSSESCLFYPPGFSDFKLLMIYHVPSSDVDPTRRPGVLCLQRPASNGVSHHHRTIVGWMEWRHLSIGSTNDQVFEKENVRYEQYMSNVVTVLSRATHMLAVPPCKTLDPRVSEQQGDRYIHRSKICFGVGI